MLSDEIEKCPHCGDSENGYRFIVHARYEQIKGFGNHHKDDYATEMDDVKLGACRCNNCKKVIKRI